MKTSSRNISILIIFFSTIFLSVQAQTYKFDKIDDVEGFVIHTDFTTATQAAETGTDGVLIFKMPDPNDLIPTSMRLDQTATIDADVMKHFTIRLKNQSDAHQLRLKNTVNGKFIEVSKTLEINSSEYKTYRVDMTNNVNWTGQIGPVYLQFRSVGRAIPINGTAITIDEISFTSAATLNTENSIKKDVKVEVYPNPIKNKLQIKTKEIIEKVDIYNIQGQKVISEINTNFIDIKNLAKGIYLSKIRLKNQNEAIIKRFIKN